MLDGSYFFECKCGSSEHTLRFVYDKSEHEIHTEVYLNNWQKWWKRLWVAVKYVFGYKCRYGHWDCWIMKDEDVKKFKEMIERFENEHDV